MGVVVEARALASWEGCFLLLWQTTRMRAGPDDHKRARHAAPRRDHIQGVLGSSSRKHCRKHKVHFLVETAELQAGDVLAPLCTVRVAVPTRCYRNAPL